MSSERRVRRARVVREGRWEYVGYIIRRTDRKFDWLVVRFPADQSVAIGEDRDWGVEATEEEAQSKVIDATDKTVSRDKSGHG